MPEAAVSVQPGPIPQRCSARTGSAGHAPIGRRVLLNDGRTGDVMGVEDEAGAARLVVIVPSVGAWQRIAPESVARDLGDTHGEEEV